MKQYLRFVLLSVSILLTLLFLPRLATASHAATFSGRCGKDLYWTLDTDTGVLTLTGSGDAYSYHHGYVGTGEDPDEAVPAFYPGWLSQRECIRSVVLPEGMTSISGPLFYNCKNLNSIRIPSTVKVIGYEIYEYESCEERSKESEDGPFDGCGFTEFTVPETVTEIGAYAFSGCTGLKSVTIPDSVTMIGEYAFRECTGLTEITIPDGVTDLREYAFSGCTGLQSAALGNCKADITRSCFLDCTSLKKFEVAEKNKAYHTDDKGVLLNKDGTELIVFPMGIKGKYNIPDGVAAIKWKVFSGCTGLTSVTIPDSVTAIASNAFENCTSLTSVLLGNCTADLSNICFPGCANLTRFEAAEENEAYRTDSKGVLFNKKKTVIRAFPKGVNGRYTIPNSVTAIGEWAFYGCTGLTGVTIPDSVTKIGGNAFSGCTGLTAVTIPDSVTRIAEYAFSGCTGLTGVRIPDSVTRIAESTFSRCSGLTGVTIPDSVTRIAEYAFSGCTSLTGVTIPDNVATVGWGAFMDCTGLNSVTIGTCKADVRKKSFSGCINLTRFEAAEENEVYCTDSKGVLFNKKKTEIILFPTGVKGAYSVPDGVATIGYCAFYRCTGLTSVTIPNSVTAIQAGAFCGCTNLKQIRIPGKTKLYYNEDEFLGVFDKGCKALSRIYSEKGSAAERFANTSDQITFIPLLDRPEVTSGNAAASGAPKLTWKAVEGAVGYRIYRADSKAGPYKLMKTTTETCYLNTSAKPEKTYYYKVTAISKEKLRYSADSEVKTRTCHLPRPVVTTSNLASTGKPKLTWKKVAGAVKYQVYRSTEKAGPYTLLKTVTGTGYTHEGAASGKTYYYKVKAIASNTNANSACSAIKTRTCHLPRPVVTVTRSSGKPKLTWKKIIGAKSYQVYRRETKTGTYKLLKTTTALTFTNTSAIKGKTYYYKVRAIHSNADAASAYSLSKSISATK